MFAQVRGHPEFEVGREQSPLGRIGHYTPFVNDARRWNQQHTFPRAKNLEAELCIASPVAVALIDLPDGLEEKLANHDRGSAGVFHSVTMFKIGGTPIERSAAGSR